MNKYQILHFSTKIAFTFLLILLIGIFYHSDISAVHAETTVRSSNAPWNSVHPYVPGCLPWKVAEKADGNFIVDLEEDECGGYYALAYYTDLSVANFHVYISAGTNEDSHCFAKDGYTSCLTRYAGYKGNAHGQICFYGEGGPSAYRNQASGCINV